MKPCPFCGGEAEIYRHALVSWVRCKECGVDTPAALPQDEQLAIDFWNTRAVEVVLCRDCKNYDQGGEPSDVYQDRHWCGKLWHYMQPDGFCAWGERDD